MPSIPLPENPSLEHLKNQAKLVQELVRDGDRGALDLVDEFHPRLNGSDLAEVDRTRFKRTSAQLVVARLYGFPSWPKLRNHVAVVDELNRPDLDDQAIDDRGDRFVTAACLAYGTGDPQQRIARAQRMLDDDPALASMKIRNG